MSAATNAPEQIVAEPTTFRTKGTAVTAWQWLRQDKATWPDWLQERAFHHVEDVCPATFEPRLHISAPQGPVTARYGDFLIPDTAARGNPTRAIYAVPARLFQDLFQEAVTVDL